MISYKFDLKKDSPDSRDYLYSIHYDKRLPSLVDLRSGCSSIVDQGELGSCTSNAIVSGLREYIFISENNIHEIRFSRIYHYWWERYFEGTVNKDSGATLRDGMKVLSQCGVCLEETRPYIIKNFTDVPTDIENQEALKYTIPAYERLTSINDIKHAIFNNKIVVFGITLYSSFITRTKKNGVVHMPFLPSIIDKELGGHAMCIVGYNDNYLNGSFIVRNSWGTSFGDNGYCYMPYKMFKYFMDIWTVQLA